MDNKKMRLKPKSREMIKEAADIVRNSEDDGAAIAFLQQTLDDDFPDLELGSMDLHEAIKVLGKDEQVGDRKALENLNQALGDFMKKHKITNKKEGNKRTRKRRRRRQRR